MHPLLTSEVTHLVYCHVSITYGSFGGRSLASVCQLKHPPPPLSSFLMSFIFHLGEQIHEGIYFVAGEFLYLYSETYK